MKKLLQQEKQHILVSPKLYFVLVFLSLTAVTSCIIELVLMLQPQIPFPSLEVAFASSFIGTIVIFVLLGLAKSDLLDEEVIAQDQAIETSIN
ncbi:hypothetical protein FE810_10060 [Thalassotalea litorea]|uniref:Uncharacterized protein n=2 Tax=Thalassotalea litorea TaxID=2020715 RepID=A0A5R9IJL7_9GAMM|nr:hypothetical protein FE810_10060 [Thalassotalea litorea]